MPTPGARRREPLEFAVDVSSRTAEHRVQFYDSEDFLASAVADFLAPGIKGGHPLVVIATEPHRASFTSQLKAKGFDVDRVTANGQLTLVDARDMLDGFMVGSAPDPDRFKSVVRSVLQTARNRGGADAVLRLYGEMVDLLWRDGNTEAALQLEQLWNDLAHTFEFSLLCAYAMGNFYRTAHAEHFEAICGHHSHVSPTERYIAADMATRLREITILEQRARALEAEIVHRTELEHRLRDALDARRLTEEALRLRERELSALLEEHQRLLESRVETG